MSSGPLPAWCAPLTLTASVPWAGLSALRNRWYDSGRGVIRLARPVISVGNTVVGGSGKSPMVRWVAEVLRETGRQPAILMRGYASADPEQSDEAIEHRQCLPEVPVLCGANRAARARRALAGGVTVDAFIMDDGFQHRQLGRDLDIVLVGADCGWARPWGYLPFGWCRESRQSLRRADAVVVTRASGVDETTAALVRQFHGREAIAWCDHAWSHIDVWPSDGGAPTCAVPDWARGRRMVAFIAIASGAAFERSIAAAGGEVAARIVLGDHAPRRPAHLEQAARLAKSTGAHGLICTGKDWAHLRPIWQAMALPRLQVAVPRVGLRFHSGESELRSRIVSRAG